MDKQVQVTQDPWHEIIESKGEMKKARILIFFALILIGLGGIFLWRADISFPLLSDPVLVYKADPELISSTISLFLTLSSFLSILWLIFYRRYVSRLRNLPPLPIFIILLLSSFLIYFISFRIGFHSDDYAWLVDSEKSSKDLSHVFSLSQSNFFRPVTHLYHLLNYLLFKEEPTFYHFSGLLLHGINSFLLFLVAAKITKSAGISLFSSLLFCTYPAFSRSIIWISGSEITFATFLYLSSLYLFLIFTQNNRLIYYLSSLGLYVLGILSKEAIITLAPTILLIYFYVQQQKRVFWGAMVFMSLAFIYLCVQIMLLSNSVLAKEDIYGVHLLVMGKSFSGYLLSSVLPYSHRLMDLWPSLRYPVLLLEIGFLVIFWSKGKEVTRLLLFWYLLLLSPYLLFNLSVQTRYLYLPLLAFSMLSACVLCILYTKFFSDSEIKKLIFHFLIIFAIIGNIFLIRIEASVMRAESEEMDAFIESVRKDTGRIKKIQQGEIPKDSPLTEDHLKAALGL